MHRFFFFCKIIAKNEFNLFITLNLLFLFFIFTFNIIAQFDHKFIVVIYYLIILLSVDGVFLHRSNKKFIYWLNILGVKPFFISVCVLFVHMFLFNLPVSLFGAFIFSILKSNQIEPLIFFFWIFQIPASSAVINIFSFLNFCGNIQKSLLFALIFPILIPLILIFLEIIEFSNLNLIYLYLGMIIFIIFQYLVLLPFIAKEAVK